MALGVLDKVKEFQATLRYGQTIGENIGFQDYKALNKRFLQISKQVSCPHNHSHILSFIAALTALPKEVEGCVVEAGCFKGGSSAKISLLCDKLQRDLVIFDSFEGLPANDEDHQTSILGHSIEDWFQEGAFSGALEEVKANIERYGVIERCEFIKGWFDETMPAFKRPVAAAYIDVDLASSTRTCLKQLYPLLKPGGVLMSQDGDFPLVIEVFQDVRFWREEVGCEKPEIEGLGTSKMLKIIKR